MEDIIKNIALIATGGLLGWYFPLRYGRRPGLADRRGGAPHGLNCKCEEIEGYEG